MVGVLSVVDVVAVVVVGGVEVVVGVVLVGTGVVVMAVAVVVTTVAVVPPEEERGRTAEKKS